MSITPYGQVVGHIFRETKSMPPVGRGKSPVVAFMAGFLGGPIGVGVYLKSFPDFLVALGMVILGSMMTAGIGAPVFWCLCGAFAAVRVKHSNAAV